TLTVTVVAAALPIGGTSAPAAELEPGADLKRFRLRRLTAPAADGARVCPRPHRDLPPHTYGQRTEGVVGLLVGAAVGVVRERVLGRPLDRFIVDPMTARRTATKLRRLKARYGISGELLRIGGHHLFIRQYTASGFQRADLVGTLGGDL